MFDYALLRTLAAIHRRGSLDLAAAQLGLTPSAVSQRLKALEEQMGTLLIRRGQPAEATPAGLRLVRHVEAVALIEADLALSIGRAGDGPVPLRLAVNADSLATWVIPALAGVEGFLFDFVIDDQDVSQDWLRRGEVAGAITSHPGPLQGCDTWPLGLLRYRATASPAYAARWFPGGIDAPSLANAPALTFSDHDQLQHRWVAAHVPGAGPRAGFPSHRLASSQGFVDACLAGLGWGLNPETLVAAHLAAGHLVDLGPDHPLDVPLYWQFARLTGPAIAPVTRAFRTAASRDLLPL